MEKMTLIFVRAVSRPVDNPTWKTEIPNLNGGKTGSSAIS
jgi:hypothetical protein